MKYLLRSILLVFTLAFNASLIAQSAEICDNAIDDDGDGLIDLNDTDCFCSIIEAISLIPNPSFEDQVCCPPDRSRMDCAETWIQASVPTTDYIHTCGWIGWPDLPMPLPIPDGEGALGFRDGRFVSISGGSGNNEESNPNWKEYAGACLLSPLRAGISYKFKFYIGFTEQPFSPPIAITFFGTTNCANLPFGVGNSQFGCPTNNPNWMQLSAISTSGTSEWKELELNVTPTVDIEAIAIGPPCQSSAASANPYYFFDNLVLAEQSAFEFEIKANNQPCAQNLSFEVPQYDSLGYQWYKDGIAILGATSPRLDLPSGKGRYEVMVTGDGGCQVTKPFNFFIPFKRASLVQTICEGDTYTLGNQQLSMPGIYFDTLKSVNNCDSLVEIDLRVDGSIATTVNAKIFPNESYKVGDFSFDQSGEYTRTIPSTIGCDSTVTLLLDYYSVYFPNTFSPNGDGINDFFVINAGTDLAEINNFRIFDRWGNQVFQQTSLVPNNLSSGWDGRFDGQNTIEGVYLYMANLLMDDGVERSVSGMVTLIR